MPVDANAQIGVRLRTATPSFEQLLRIRVDLGAVRLEVHVPEAQHPRSSTRTSFGVFGQRSCC
jgi:hypothetical protein